MQRRKGKPSTCLPIASGPQTNWKASGRWGQLKTTKRDICAVRNFYLILKSPFCRVYRTLLKIQNQERPQREKHDLILVLETIDNYTDLATKKKLNTPRTHQHHASNTSTGRQQQTNNTPTATRKTHTKNASTKDQNAQERRVTARQANTSLGGF